MTTTPSPGVTTPPTDEQRDIAFRLMRPVFILEVDSYNDLNTAQQSVVDRIAQALADQAAAIHARYEKVAQRCDREAEGRSHFAKVDPEYRHTVIPYEAAADWIREVSR